jgi:acyl-coenzyme A synthetase/AMP-(fatty) acid ligase
VVLAELPKTATGKIQRFRLRDAVADRLVEKPATQH